jgi:two-component system LytT family response regulator
MKRISCIIIDDEPNAVKLLENHIAKIPILELRQVCYNGLEGLNYIKDNPVDLIFLDINIPLLTGMELATIISTRQKIIFTTAYSEYAVGSYEYDALDYILKPITFARFLKAVAKAEKFFQLQMTRTEPGVIEENYMFVKTERQLVKINYSDIFYFEAQKEYVNICALKTKYMFYKRMKDLEEQLPVNFLRIHHSFIINLNYITKVEGNSVTVNNNEIPVGISYREAFQNIVRSKTF